MTFLQAQYDIGGWAQGLELFKQLKAGRGLGFAASNAAVHGLLLELLVVRGGVDGIVAAVEIVDECHVSGKSTAAAAVAAASLASKEIWSQKFYFQCSTMTGCHQQQQNDLIV